MFTREIQSAPPSSAAWAFIAMLSTLGESFTMSGVFFKEFFDTAVTSFILSGLMPKAYPLSVWAE